MEEDLIARLNQQSERLHKRALELSHPGQDDDMATVMSSLAVISEALRSVGVIANRLDGLPGFERR
jgi:hypothetical protein